MMEKIILEAYKKNFGVLEKKGFKMKINVMDNQATKYMKQFLTKKECEMQLVEPHHKRVNAANELSKHGRMHSLQHWPRRTPNSRSNYGID